MKSARRRRTASGPRAFARRRPQTGSDLDRISAVAEDAGQPVAEVLKAVSDFRLALEMDMILAAAAADADEPAIAAQVVDGERAELASFQDRVLDRLADLEVAERPARRRSNVVTGLIATAAALVGLFGSGVALRSADRDVAPRAVSQDTLVDAATAKLGKLTQQVALRESQGASAESVAAAATELHQTLAPLMDRVHGNPALARQIYALLAAEQQVLQSTQPAGISRVLAQAKALVRTLRQKAPAGVLAPVTSPKPKPKPSPAKSSAKPSPKPSPSSSPSPQPSSSSSADPNSSNGPVPNGPQQPLP
ncbi:MAG: hypothetical protein ABR520_05975 [Mycobacteriales bacterium]